MSKINIVFFNVPKNLPLIGELFNYYKAQKDFEAAIIDGASEVAQVLSMSGNGIVIFKIENKPDLQAAVTLLKSQKKLLKKGTLKVACLSFVKSKKVDKILAKYGCQEILDPKATTSKTFSFKVNFWSKNIRAQIIEEEKDLAFKQRSAKELGKEAVGANAKKEDFTTCEALTLQSDIWISKHKNDHKRILKRYLSRMLGPSPHVGKWMELEPQPGDKMPTWKFVVKDPEGQLILEDGAWYFSGSKPEFDWKINRWNFSSERPHLYFYTQEGKAFSRLKFNNGQVLLAENSTYALTKEDFILTTCDSTFSFDGESSNETSESLEGDSKTDEVDAHYEGESKSEHLDDKLRGESSTDTLDDEKHQGKSKYQEDDLGGNLEGKGHTDELDTDPLSGNLTPGVLKEEEQEKGSNYQEEAIDGHLGGKSSTDQINSDPLSGDVRHGDVREEERNSKSKYQDEEIEKNYNGKSETDELDRDPLTGELRPDNTKEKDDGKDSSFSEEAISAHYNGKSSTDQIDNPELEGRLKTGQVREESQGKKNQFVEEELGGHYGGKSKTDELDRDPLSGELGPGAPTQNKERKPSQFQEDDLGGNYGGKAHTDELERDPLSGELIPPTDQVKEDNPRSGQAAESLENLSGKSASDELERDPLTGELGPGKIKAQDDSQRSHQGEDDLGGHYGGKSKLDELDHDPLSGELASQNHQDKKDSRTTHSEDDLGGHYSGVDNQDEALGGVEAKAKSNPEIEELERELDSDLLPRSGKLKEEAPVPTDFEDSKLTSKPRFAPDTIRSTKENEIAEALGGELTSDSVDHGAQLRSKVVNASSEKKAPGVDLDKLIGESMSINTESGEVKVIVTATDGAGNQVNHICTFDDFFPDELVVRMSSNALTKGQSVRAMARLQYDGQKLVVEANGEVEEIEEIEEGYDSVIIAIDAIDEQLYEKFMGLYQQRQESIHEFMKQAQGIG